MTHTGNFFHSWDWLIDYHANFLWKKKIIHPEFVMKNNVKILFPIVLIGLWKKNENKALRYCLSCTVSHPLLLWFWPRRQVSFSTLYSLVQGFQSSFAWSSTAFSIPNLSLEIPKISCMPTQRLGQSLKLFLQPAKNKKRMFIKCQGNVVLFLLPFFYFFLF